MNTTISASYYTDVEILRRERQQIFAANWWLLGPASACRDRGDYLCDTICGWPILAIRDDDNQLRAFHNVCRHRGSSLLEAGQGNCAKLRCPYHGWLYGSNGDLLKAPGFASDEINPAETGLISMRVTTWMGMIFVCPASDGQPAVEFESWLGSLPGLISGFPTIDDMQYYGQFVVEGQANWKTYCDNTVEGYHLHSVHPRLAKAVAAGKVDIVSYDEGALVAFHVGYGAAASAAELRGDAGIWTYKFPGFQLAISDNAFKIERLEPTGIDRLRSTNWAWYRDLSDAQRQDSFDWSRTVVEEDIGICEKVQVNLAAGVYHSGPLSSEHEPHVATLQRFYLAALGQSDHQQEA